jgi:murein DD-endopeptidase MepM/ murein hydrolase activator NlpD
VAAASESPLAAPPRPSQRIVAVRRGDTLMDILLSLGIPRAEAHEAVSALSSVYDLRGLRPGQEITFTFAPGAPGQTQPLVGAWLAARADRDVGVSRDSAGRFVPEQHDKELILRPVRARGTVSTSLYEAGVQAGIPAGVMVELIRVFSFDVDFQREIQPGDSFDVFFERFVDGEGRGVKTGALAFASLTLSGKTHAVYRFVDRDGVADFFNEKGESVRKALLKTPIDGARLTSGFGNRMHPILGYSAFHKGVDFGAPTGTPIQAAGDGVVEQKGWNGSYGNYVRIRHSGEYATAYAHMSRFASGLKDGARVRQGQIIGYVGSTGRSTGAHLHYEILRRGAQVNPVNVKFPTGRKLEGIDLTRFRNARLETDRAMAQATVQEPARVAALPTEQ